MSDSDTPSSQPTSQGIPAGWVGVEPEQTQLHMLSSARSGERRREGAGEGRGAEDTERPGGEPPRAGGGDVSVRWEDVRRNTRTQQHQSEAWLGEGLVMGVVQAGGSRVPG